MADTADVSRTAPWEDDGAYRHEALLYSDDAEYVTVLAEFVREGIAAGEPVLVAVPGGRLHALRNAVPEAAGLVRWVDMLDVGDNPARLIALWRDFLDAAGGRPSRGIGEPVHSGRQADQLEECRRHEQLLNLAFAGRTFRLLCPYDRSSLDASVLEHAREAHRWVHEEGAAGPSATFRSHVGADEIYAGELPAPAVVAAEMVFRRWDLSRLRRFVGSGASESGLGPSRAADMVLAADEIATNYLTHGGSGGTIRWWSEDGSFICELAGGGTIDDPMAGRFRPDPTSPSGRGLWLANQLCDLVQIRNTETGSVVRLRSRLGAD